MKSTSYVLQAALVLLWWAGLGISDSFSRAFQFTGIGATAFNAFFLPDLLVIVVLSVVRAYTERPMLEYVILGGFGYGTLYCLQAMLLTGSGYLPTAVMTLGCAFNLWLVYGEQSFRQSRSSNVYLNAGKTFLQIAGVWSITLVGIPFLILQASGHDLAVSGSPITWIGGALFLLGSVLNLISAFYLVSRGEGTPLPLDQTNRLVIAGPYRYLRNPMAVAGVTQGLAIGIFFGSLPVIAYALLGAILWQVTVRPVEEADMGERFGHEYKEYAREVPCWFPHLGR